MLGDNSIYFCPGYKHRIAVIGFGDLYDRKKDEWKVYIDPLELNPSLELLPQWTDKKYALMNKITIRDEDFSGTFMDHKGALKKAISIFSDWEKQEVDANPRKRAIIIIGDGNMCTESNKCNFSKTIADLEPIVDPNGSQEYSKEV
jgi:hypothetical protein